MGAEATQTHDVGTLFPEERIEACKGIDTMLQQGHVEQRDPQPLAVSLSEHRREIHEAERDHDDLVPVVPGRT